MMKFVSVVAAIIVSLTVAATVVDAQSLIVGCPAGSAAVPSNVVLSGRLNRGGYGLTVLGIPIPESPSTNVEAVNVTTFSNLATPVAVRGFQNGQTLNAVLFRFFNTPDGTANGTLAWTPDSTTTTTTACTPPTVALQTIDDSPKLSAGGSLLMSSSSTETITGIRADVTLAATGSDGVTRYYFSTFTFRFVPSNGIQPTVAPASPPGTVPTLRPLAPPTPVPTFIVSAPPGEFSPLQQPSEPTMPSVSTPSMPTPGTATPPTNAPAPVMPAPSMPAPTIPVTPAPVPLPTTSPVAVPTTSPVAVPTTSPVAVPTTSPVAVPTMTAPATPVTPAPVPAGVPTIGPVVPTPILPTASPVTAPVLTPTLPAPTPGTGGVPTADGASSLIVGCPTGSAAVPPNVVLSGRLNRGGYGLTVFGIPIPESPTTNVEAVNVTTFSNLPTPVAVRGFQTGQTLNAVLIRFFNTPDGPANGTLAWTPDSTTTTSTDCAPPTVALQTIDDSPKLSAGGDLLMSTSSTETITGINADVTLAVTGSDGVTRYYFSRYTFRFVPSNGIQPTVAPASPPGTVPTLRPLAPPTPVPTFIVSAPPGEFSPLQQPTEPTASPPTMMPVDLTRSTTSCLHSLCVVANNGSDCCAESPICMPMSVGSPNGQCTAAQSGSTRSKLKFFAALGGGDPDSGRRRRLRSIRGV